MDESELKKQIAIIDNTVDAIVINSQESYEDAGAVVFDLDKIEKKITAYWEEPIKKAFETHRSLTCKRNEMLKPVQDRKKMLRSKLSKFLTDLEFKRQEEQRKVDEERRKKEEAERLKLLKKADTQAAKGNIEKAEALRETAAEVYVPPAVVQSEVEKTTWTEAGTISQTKDIKITITNEMEIIKQVASSRLPLTILTINESKLKKAIKDYALNNVPGCVIENVVNAQIRKAVG